MSQPSEQLCIPGKALRVGQHAGLTRIASQDQIPLRLLLEGYRPLLEEENGKLWQGKVGPGFDQHVCYGIDEQRASLDAALLLALTPPKSHWTRNLFWLIEAESLSWPQQRALYRSATGQALRSKQQWQNMNAEEQLLLAWQTAQEQTPQASPEQAMFRLLCDYRGFCPQTDIDQLIAPLDEAQDAGSGRLYLRRAPTGQWSVLLQDTETQRALLLLSRSDGSIDLRSLPHKDYTLSSSSLESEQLEGPQQALERLSRTDSRSPSSYQYRPRYSLTMLRHPQIQIGAPVTATLSGGRLKPTTRTVVRFKDPRPTLRQQEDARLAHAERMGYRSKRTPKRKDEYTRADLVEQAKQRGIRGYSGMSTEQLVLELAQWEIDQASPSQLFGHAHGAGFLEWSYSFNGPLEEGVGLATALYAYATPNARFVHPKLAPRAQRVVSRISHYEVREAQLTQPLNPFCDQ